MDAEVLVVGAGGAGLAVAACLRRRGVESVVVDRGDAGTRLSPDAVIAATGYTTGLAPLVGHLGVLDRRGAPLVTGSRHLPIAPGVRFIGMSNPLKGQLLQIRLHARSIARAITRELRRG